MTGITITARTLDRPNLTVTPMVGPVVHLSAPAVRVAQVNTGVPGPRGDQGEPGPPGPAQDLSGIALDGGYF